MMFRGLLSFLLLLFLSVFAASKGVAKPSFDSKISSKVIQSDDAVTLTLTAKWPKAEGNYTFRLPAIIPTNLDIIRRGQSRETFRLDERDWIRETFEIVLKPNGKGEEGAIQSAFIGYIHEGTDKPGTFTIPPYEITIVQGNQVPSSIKQASFLGALCLTALVALGLVLRRKRKVKDQVTGQREDPTIHALKKILAENEGDTKTALFEISKKLRAFVIDYYHLENKQATDSEIIQALDASEQPREEMTHLKRLIKDLRDAKYVGTTSPSTVKKLQEEVLKFISSKRVLGGTP